MGYPHWERPQLLQELHNVQTEYEKKFVSIGLPIYKLKVIHKIDKN